MAYAYNTSTQKTEEDYKNSVQGQPKQHWKSLTQKENQKQKKDWIKICEKELPLHGLDYLSQR